MRTQGMVEQEEQWYYCPGERLDSAEKILGEHIVKLDENTAQSRARELLMKDWYLS